MAIRFFFVMTGEDARRSVELGAEGVLLASGIVKSDEPSNALEAIIHGLI